MQRRNFQFLALLIFVVLITGCEKEVNINLQAGSPKLVVDGFIESGQPPIVILTQSIGYFSKIDLQTLENSFLHGAQITVSDGTRSVRLREYALDTGVNMNKFYLYTIDTTDPSAFSFRGQSERVYYLNIQYGGKVYEATTKIPNAKPVDSIWFRKTEKPNITNAARMYVRFTDPDTLGNYIRYFTRRNNEIFLTGPQSVYDDAIVNGATIDSLTVFAGYDRARQPNLDSVGVFFVGDTVTLRWCAIDRDVYRFYNTFEYATGTVGNPFAAPVNVLSNIKGGALGVWAGYGATYVTKVVMY